MQKFFLAASQIHKKFRCNKNPSMRKLGNFLVGLDKFLFENKTYDEIRVLFTNYYVEHHDVFCIVNELISPQNSNKINTLADFLKNIDALKKRES